MSTQTDAAAGSGSAASVYLCAFGKHPGWNDHIDDLGLETERLVQVKRLLYVEGIGANIDAGTWDKLGPGQQLGAFGHVLMWRRPGGSGDLILARLWSSSDGKGRTRYPMVVCAQIRGASLRWALENVLPELERLETACKSATSAPDVVRLIDDSRAALRGRAARAEAPKAEVVLEPETFADLVGRPELGPDRQGLLRLLYQVQREMGAFARESPLIAGSVKGKSIDPRPQQVRVPACSPTPAGAVSAWAQFMLTLVEPQHPMVIIVPLPEVVRGAADAGAPDHTPPSGGWGGWADIVLGDPGAAQLMCIRATPKGLPLTTEIPYSIDAVFASTVDAWAKTVMSGAGTDGGRKVLADLPPRERKGSAAYAGAVANGAAAAKRARKGLPIALIVGVLLLGGIAAAVVIAMLVAGDDASETADSPSNADAPAHAADASPANAEPTKSSTPAPRPGASEPAAAAVSSDTTAAENTSSNGAASASFDAPAWRALCEAYRDWMSGFLRRLEEPAPAALSTAPNATRLDAYLAEPGLSELVRPMADSGMIGNAAGAALDPWGIAGASRSRDLGSLTRAPGDAVKTAEAADKIARAGAIVGTFRGGLTTTWPAPALLRDQAAAFRTLGWDAAADEADAAAKGVGVRDGQDVAAGIDAAIIAAAKVRRIDAVLARCRAISARGVEMNDDVLAALAPWAESLPAAASSTDSLDRLADALSPAADIAQRLETFLDREYAGVDAAAFRTSEQYAALAALAKGQSAAGGRGARLDSATFDQWVYRARAFPSLDRTLDPRNAWEPGPVLAAIAHDIKTLEAPPLQSPLDDETKARIEQAAADVEAVEALPWNVSTRAEVESRTRSADESLRQVRLLVDRRIASARERLGKSDAEVRQSLGARETIVASGAINGAWRSWRDALLKKYNAEQYQDLSKAAADLRESLVQVDEQIVPPAKITSADGPWAAPLTASLAKEREQIIARTVAALNKAETPTAETIVAAGNEAKASFADKLAAAEELSARASIVDRLLNAGYTLDEEASEPHNNTPPRGFVDTYRANIDAGDLGQLGTRLVELERTEKQTDPAALSRLVLDPAPGRPELAVAAWRRLAAMSRQPGSTWPGSIDDVQQATRMRAALAVPLGDIADTSRRDALNAQIGKDQASIWTAWADRADAAAIDKTLALAPAMGVSAESMPEWMRYNARLAEFRGECAAAPDEPKAKAATQRFLDDVAQMPDAVRQRPSVAVLTALLEPMLDGSQPAESAVDPLTLGPGAAGASGESGAFMGSSPDNGKTLVFTDQRGMSLRFIRVEHAASGELAAGAFYLGQTELSVAQAAALITGRAAKEDRASVLARLDEITEVNQGVRTWNVLPGAHGEGPVLVPAATWFPKVSGMSDQSLYPEKARPGPPGELSPMQQIPPDVALWLARLAGCRLPTRAEWTAAWAVLGDSVSPQSWNIRDESVAKVDAHIAEIETRYVGVPRPDAGIFVPSGEGHEGLGTGDDAQNAGWDDGVLWFADVAAGVKGGVVTGDGAHHLMGNVAEYLFDPSTPSAAVSARLSDAEAAVREGAISIVGQSALLDRREPGTRPASVGVDGAVDGFADVGVRLAFAADGSRMAPRPLAERLADSARAAQFLTAR